MEKIGDIGRLKEHQNIILEGFDPVSAGGFTQLPNCVLNDPHLSPGGKVIYAKLLSSQNRHPMLTTPVKSVCNAVIAVSLRR